ncbi:MAG TPA: thioredoxin family protein [Casimicrobiaceae bacterium]|jgi:thioredoxin reductase (NADPH)|nr:thioredoxin family protein [Casimicrobiaceae bacterium]
MLTKSDLSSIGSLPTPAASPLVIALCAAWCDTCTEFRATFERIADARPGMIFVWLDIEDDSEICGEIDIENFPTLAIYRGTRLLHYGVSLPQEGTVARLIDEIAERSEVDAAAPQAVHDLPKSLSVAAAK